MPESARSGRGHSHDCIARADVLRVERGLLPHGLAPGNIRSTGLPGATGDDESKRLDPASVGEQKTDRPCRYRSRIRPALQKRYSEGLEPTRIDILKQLLEQNPGSAFARYGLAMEYVKA